MREKEPFAVCLSGHRQIPMHHALLLPGLLEQRLLSLYEDGAREFRAGGALGFDMVGELKILELRERLPDIRLHLYLPCRDQANFWNEGERRAYRYVLSLADHIHYTADIYTQGCMLARNREMVAGSRVCLGYCTKVTGGTAYTFRHAVERGLAVINLARECEKI